MSWLAIDDAIGAIRHALRTDGLRGPVNATSPEPVTNREFTATLGRVLGRPTLAPVPAAALRLMFGEMADAALFAGTRAVPARLLATGYHFLRPTLDAALRAVLSPVNSTASPSS